MYHTALFLILIPEPRKPQNAPEPQKFPEPPKVNYLHKFLNLMLALFWSLSVTFSVNFALGDRSLGRKITDVDLFLDILDRFTRPKNLSES